MLTDTWFIAELAETEALAHALGELCEPGLLLALNGGLGAGKTHFVRALARGLRCTNPDAVNSPTFVLIQEYPGPLPLYHFDAYRLSGAAEFQDLGAAEYFAEPSVCVVEWAERVEEALPTERIHVQIDIRSETARQWTITSHGAKQQRIHELWRAARENSQKTKCLD